MSKTSFLAALPSGAASFSLRDGEARLVLDIPESDAVTVAALALRLNGVTFRVTIEPEGE